MKAKRGFTLIEMLTVIVIISILAAATMKMMVYVNQKTGRSRAAGEIERIKHALTEYYAVYGCYPPASGMVWEYKFSDPAAPPDQGLGYYDGLAKYLLSDPEQRRWDKYLVGMPDSGLKRYDGSRPGGFGNVTWTNRVTTIHDPWDRDYQYFTKDPYQTFKLYSLGPDGQSNTVDDVGNSWIE